MDFYLYRVQLADNVRATIYYGRHPNTKLTDRGIESNCSKVSAARCIIQVDAQRIEALYQAAPQDASMHLTISVADGSDEKLAKEFISTFRACETNDHGVECSPGELFDTTKDHPTIPSRLR
ncbi:hypothetical protein [Luteibacter rhizovicinus]|uniref:hypothetical protein n=1 Tax=Luteibacter rhizovicinus TaxID=242606 RepID=UPI00104BA78B|nr:hypothetical protein [Luteibacter rhizovicinus]